MSKTSMSGRFGRQLASVDPGDSVSESELARSRARSLSFLNSETEARIGAVSRIDAHTPSHTSFRANPTRIRRRIVLASAAAALLAGVIVVADVTLPNHPGATAEAVEVLNNAAAATIQTSDPVVGAGQYLKIETTSVNFGGAQAADGSQLSWLDKTGGQLYVPADREGEWVWNREERLPLESSSEAAKAAAAEMRKADQGRPEGQPPMVGILRAPGGAFYGSEPTVIAGTPLTEAGSLPRDPQALLNLIYERTKGAGKSPEREAFVTIADSLRTGVVPADLRATLYKAAALIPGVTVGDRQATVDGRTGIAIGIPSPDGVARTDIIIDPTSGLVIGEQDVLLKDYPGFPAGTVSTWTSVKTSVVDSAP
ncbi:CU044_5270 family protein [Pseudarthrobacter sp. P1]|uniref:CU044_5270 family protein n=1 Tax=Pseudarthrobacter sp. P1 TaxID=3418418 RepID=UPI003CF89272